MSTNLTPLEIDVLRTMNGEDVPGMIAGAAMWEAARSLRAMGYAAGTYHITIAGKAYLAMLDADKPVTAERKFEQHATGYQIVDAERRADLFYRDRKGFFWHELDQNCAIIVPTITGPYATRDEALDAARSCPRHQQGAWKEFS